MFLQNLANSKESRPRDRPCCWRTVLDCSCGLPAALRSNLGGKVWHHLHRRHKAGHSVKIESVTEIVIVHAWVELASAWIGGCPKHMLVQLHECKVKLPAFSSLWTSHSEHHVNVPGKWLVVTFKRHSNAWALHRSQPLRSRPSWLLDKSSQRHNIPIVLYYYMLESYMKALSNPLLLSSA